MVVFPSKPLSQHGLQDQLTAAVPQAAALAGAGGGPTAQGTAQEFDEAHA